MSDTKTVIGFRGPQSIPVLNRNAVQVSDICSDLIYSETTDRIRQRYNISDKELISCIEKYTEHSSNRDFVELACSTEDKEMYVETVGLSDWVFLVCLLRGKQKHPRLRKTEILYARGAESYIIDCFKEVIEHSNEFMKSDIHRIMFNGFQDACGKVTAEKAPELLRLLGYTDKEERQ